VAIDETGDHSVSSGRRCECPTCVDRYKAADTIDRDTRERDTLRRALTGLTRFCAKATRYVGHGVDLIEHANGPYVMFSDIESVLRSPEPREPEAASTEPWDGIKGRDSYRRNKPTVPEPKEPQP
jgi:hypothetical protein